MVMAGKQKQVEREICPARPRPRGHYVVTIGRVTFCMDCGANMDMEFVECKVKPSKASTMTPAEVKAARLAMGMTQAQLAAALELTGENGKRTVRHWESDGGKFQITGPARVAIRLLLAANSEMRKLPFAACDQLKTLGDE